MVAFRDLLDHVSEMFLGTLRARLLVQGPDGNREFALPAAMFAGQFVKTAFDGLPSPKQSRVQSQHFLATDGVEHPVGDGPTSTHKQPPVETVLTARSDDASISPKLLRCSSSPVLMSVLMRVPSQPIEALRTTPYNPCRPCHGWRTSADHRRVMRRKRCFTGSRTFEFVHDLGDAVNENVFVVNRGEAFDAGHNLHILTVMLVPANLFVGFLRQRGRMGVPCAASGLSSTASATSEMNRSALLCQIGRKMLVGTRGFSDHPAMIGFSMTVSRGFGVSMTRSADSGF